MDSVKLNDDLPALNARFGHRLVQRRYYDNAVEFPRMPEPVCFMYKHTFIHVNPEQGIGWYVGAHELSAYPACERKEHVMIYRFDFELYIMLDILERNPEYDLHETLHPSTTLAMVSFQDHIVEIRRGIISCSNVLDAKVFTDHCNQIRQLYTDQVDYVRSIYANYVEKFPPDHMTNAFPVWFRSSRIVQNVVPDITWPDDNREGLIFPENGPDRMKYIPKPGYNIILRTRYDNSTYPEVPVQVTRLKAVNKRTWYKEPQTPVVFVIEKGQLKGIIRGKGQWSMQIDGRYTEAKIFYPARYIREANPVDCDMQRLNEYNGLRTHVYVNNEWVESEGVEMIGIPVECKDEKSWRIYHDYHMLNRLTFGPPYDDIRFHSYVNPESDYVIRVTNEIYEYMNEKSYRAPCLQTHVHLDFGFQRGVRDAVAITKYRNAA